MWIPVGVGNRRWAPTTPLLCGQLCFPALCLLSCPCFPPYPGPPLHSHLQALPALSSILCLQLWTEPQNRAEGHRLALRITGHLAAHSTSQRFSVTLPKALFYTPSHPQGTSPQLSRWITGTRLPRPSAGEEAPTPPSQPVLSQYQVCTGVWLSLPTLGLPLYLSQHATPVNVCTPDSLSASWRSRPTPCPNPSCSTASPVIRNGPLTGPPCLLSHAPPHPISHPEHSDLLTRARLSLCSFKAINGFLLPLE